MAEKSFENVGAWILGRNMFSPGRGKWDMDWKGWWGEEPPYHCPTFVLTHYPRDPLEMKGGTVFHFVTGGIQDALDAPGLRPVGAMCAWGRCPPPPYLSARLIDELHLAMRPVFLGTAKLFQGLDLPTLGWCYQQIAGERATHLLLRRLVRSQGRNASLCRNSVVAPRSMSAARGVFCSAQRMYGLGSLGSTLNLTATPNVSGASGIGLAIRPGTRSSYGGRLRVLVR
jgi:dihydrofolate reductase